MKGESNKTKTTSIATDVLIGSVIASSCIIDSDALPPEGWLLCNGSAFSRAGYAGLFNAIGVLYGKGDGVTTFNIPDYRGMFLRGTDHGSGRDPDAALRKAVAQGGSEKDSVGSVQSFATAPPSDANKLHLAAAGNHTHAVPHLPVGASFYSINGETFARWNPGSIKSSEAGEHFHTINGGGDTETRPINLSVNYLIYYGQKETK